MDGKGSCNDNLFIERLWRTVKYEEVYLKAYRDGSEARAALAAYFGETRPGARAKVATRPEQSGRVIGAERRRAWS